MAFSWSWVYRFITGLQCLVGEVSKWLLLRKVLPEKSIGILIRSAFPRRVRMSKVEVHTCFVSNDGMVSKFSSIIWCEREFICCWYGFKDFLHSITGIPSGLLLHVFWEKVSARSLYCRKYSMTSCFCWNNSIYFPMSDLTKRPSYLRVWILLYSLFNHNSIWDLVLLFACFHLLLIFLSSSSEWRCNEGRMMISYVFVYSIFWEFFSSFCLPSSCYLLRWISERIFLGSSHAEENIFLQVTSWVYATVKRLVKLGSPHSPLVSYIFGFCIQRVVSTETRDRWLILTDSFCYILLISPFSSESLNLNNFCIIEMAHIPYG